MAYNYKKKGTTPTYDYAAMGRKGAAATKAMMDRGRRLEALQENLSEEEFADLFEPDAPARKVDPFYPS